ncbi:hypothetical protein JMJ35_003178 [Cladonia borealis]|uniref:Uncharacterized protein n=1 Tax=Cladonia borealis TaxID=184061 RepID=A0AA39R5R7_9LECA|nr:hypothetical protein JMJ35_003178 [Cladonia borealis]
MAYQNSYGAHPHMYNSGGANAGHFPHQQLPHPQQQQQQQQQQFYPNPYPQSAAPSPSYVQPQGSQGPANQVPRQPYLPNQSHGSGGPHLMPPPSNVPDDPFKKPYLPQQRTTEPQQQYIHNAQSPPFNPRYSQQPPATSAPSISNTSTTSRETIQPTTTSLSYTPVSSMTAPAVPVTSSAQVASPPESPSQPQDPSSQTSKSSAIDQERIDALLTVNNLLLQEVQILQKAGLKATAQSPQQANPANASSPQTKPEAATPTSTDPAEAAGQNAPTPSSVTTPTTTTPTTLVPPQPSNNPTQNQKKFVEYMGQQTNTQTAISCTPGATACMACGGS